MENRYNNNNNNNKATHHLDVGVRVAHSSHLTPQQTMRCDSAEGKPTRTMPICLNFALKVNAVNDSISSQQITFIEK